MPEALCFRVVRPDVRPDYFVYAITQVLLDGISGWIFLCKQMGFKIGFESFQFMTKFGMCVSYYEFYKNA